MIFHTLNAMKALTFRFENVTSFDFPKCFLFFSSTLHCNEQCSIHQFHYVPKALYFKAYKGMYVSLLFNSV